MVRRNGDVASRHQSVAIVETEHVCLDSADRCELACAHLSEAGDDFTGITTGELHCIFAQAVESLGE